MNSRAGRLLAAGALIAALLLAACAKPSLATFVRMDGPEYAAICIENRMYVPYTAFDRTECGEQLGIVDGDSRDKVYTWKEHDPAEWIISGLDHDGVMLYREQNVTEIPDGIESEYEWNNI